MNLKFRVSYTESMATNRGFRVLIAETFLNQIPETAEALFPPWAPLPSLSARTRGQKSLAKLGS